MFSIIGQPLIIFLDIVTYLILARAIISWLPLDAGNPFVHFFASGNRTYFSTGEKSCT